MSEIKNNLSVDALQRANREKYSKEGTYSAATIVSVIPDNPVGTYSQQLLWERFQLLYKYLKPGTLIDLCCGNGLHLAGLNHLNGFRVGLDFSEVYMKYAQQSFAAEDAALAFVCCSATFLPLATGTVKTLYSFSALYNVGDLPATFRECYSILKPGGIAILDLGNRRSLNVICSRYYPDAATILSENIEKHLRQCRAAGFDILEHRSFQIIPLWCDRPKWLWPLLHPVWTKIMAKRIRGKMLDEWISSLPILRHFAFRHLVVCRKPVIKKS